MTLSAWRSRCGGTQAHRRRWQDSSDKKLEEFLGEISLQILVSGEILIRHAVQEEYQRKVQRRAELLEIARRKKEKEEREERERIERLKQQRIEQLVKDAASWRQATDVRAYVRAVVDAKSFTSGDSAQEWATWALHEADQMDPLSRE